MCGQLDYMNELNGIIKEKIQLLYTSTNSNLYMDQIDEIHESYNLTYVAIANEISNMDINTQRDKFIRIISSEQIIDKLNDIANKIITDDPNNNNIKKYMKLIIPNTLIFRNISNCAICGCDLVFSDDKISLDCFVCNNSYIFDHMVNDITKLTYKSKHGNFKPNRHSKCWIDRILARENEEEIGEANNPDNRLGETLIAEMKEKCRKGCMSLDHMTIDEGRRLLRELKKTHLNRNISLIMKKLTGRGPPHISEEIYQKCYSLFLQVMDAREHIVFKNKNNRIYYPYYIYKIFDIELSDENDRKVLNFIHLHKHTTLTNNDREWEAICNIVPYLKSKYKSTIPGIKYI